MPRRPAALGEDLPLPMRHVRGKQQPQVKLRWAQGISGNGTREGISAYLKRKWKQFYIRISTASTGSPSDGLEASTSASASSGSAPQKVEHDDDASSAASDWVVEEVFVDGKAEANDHTQSISNAPSKSSHAPSPQPSTRRASSNSYVSVWTFCRYHLWLYIKYFFKPCYEDPEKELEFQKQRWYTEKLWAFFASLYLVVNWVLYLVLNRWSTNPTVYAQAFYYGGLSALTLPLPFMIALDFPRKKVLFFQIWVSLAAWYCGVTEIIQIKLCKFFIESPNQCFGKDFLAMLYYITAVPALLMFTVSERLYNFIMMVVVFILLMVFVIPDEPQFGRNVVNFLVFSLFMQGLHFSKEKSQRRIFWMNQSLKTAYRAVQRAQLAEGQASNAKNRFASYIFHEVRVPLNVCILAFDELKRLGVLSVDNRAIQSEVAGLDVNLQIMGKILNDALDLNKMDRGQFENHIRPFHLHGAIRSTLEPVSTTASAQGITLEIDLDPAIDALRSDHSTDGLWVLGDDLRFRQILTNLVSNALKFVPVGSGLIQVKTQLLEIQSPQNIVDEPIKVRQSMRFRLEVHDNGPGVSPTDLKENRLFQPFVQTAVGRKSGKGSGLGLAIVRQIVTLSHGRLGVTSRRDYGATFWIELPYDLATASDIASHRKERSASSPSTCETYPPSRLPIDTGNRTWIRKARVPFYEIEPFAPSSYLPTPLSDTVINDGRTNADYIRISDATPVSDSLYDGHISQTSRTENEDPIRVLIVDDDSFTRDIMKKIFSTMGCTVDTAEDGHQFLDAVSTQTYDIITLDNYMPRMTGEEAIAKFRELGRDEFVVGCTGNALTTDTKRYLDAGLDTIYTKPLNRAILQRLVEDARDRRRRS